jgi:ElaB/YqjD/DUF883 family membrane-anchored ribosome-binding protein
METTSSAKITEALVLLEEAAKQKKDELKGALSNKYTHLVEAVVETEHGLVASLAHARKWAVTAATHAKDASTEKAGVIAADVERNVEEHPWSYIAGSAALAGLLGYLLGRRHK